MTLRQARRKLQLKVGISDALLALLAAVAANDLHSSILFESISRPAYPSLTPEGNVVLLAATLAAPLAVAALTGYRFSRRWTTPRLFWLSVGAAPLATVLLMGLVRLVLMQPIGPLYGPIFCTYFGLMLFASRAVYWRVRSPGADWPEEHRNIVILGSGQRAQGLAEHLQRVSARRCRTFFLDDEPSVTDQQALGDALVGGVKDLAALVERQAVDQVIFALPARFLASKSVARAFSVCERVGIDFTLSSDLFESGIALPAIDDLLGIPALTFSTRHHHGSASLALKRGLDIAVSALGLLLLAPFSVLLAIAIKLDSPGPVFFSQDRCGLHGRRFRFIKLRTMHVGAEARLAQLRELNEVSGPVFKMQHDPRVTRIGRFLRKYSIDELPQLYNVLVGHMSLVGPRPPIPDEVRMYEEDQRRRLSMRPGITCLWQVSGRSDVAFEDWVKLDLDYIDHWTLALDLRILAETIPAVLSARGAS